MNRLKLMKKIIHKTKINGLSYPPNTTNNFSGCTQRVIVLLALFCLTVTLFGCASARIDFIEESKNVHRIINSDLLSAGLDNSLRQTVSYEVPARPDKGYAILKTDYNIPPYIEFGNIIEKIGDTLPDFFYLETYQTNQAPPLNESIITIWKNEALVAKVKISQPFKGVMALVIDDVGNNSKALETALMIKRPVTYAVLPKLALTEKLAKILRDEGHVLILHQPMAAVSDIYPGPGFIEKDMDDTQIINLLNENFSELPWVTGMNNHMGSAITADKHKMEIILSYLKKNNLFFLDSVTGDTVCSDVAENINYPIYKRDVFIDNKDDKAYINGQIDRLVKVAVKHGTAVGIGHFKPLTMQCIYERLDDFDRQGIKLVYINELSR